MNDSLALADYTRLTKALDEASFSRYSFKNNTSLSAPNWSLIEGLGQPSAHTKTSIYKEDNQQMSPFSTPLPQSERFLGSS